MPKNTQNKETWYKKQNLTQFIFPHGNNNNNNNKNKNNNDNNK